jgi:hypothetical protein
VTVAAATFLLLAVLLLWTVIYGRGPLLAKAVLVVLVPWWCFALWQAFLSFDGWPAERALPADAELVAYQVREPSANDEGAIFLWVVASGDEGALTYRPSGEPRAYRLPYSRQDHQQLENARRALAQGRIVKVRRNRTQARPTGQSDSDRSRSRLRVRTQEQPVGGTKDHP